MFSIPFLPKTTGTPIHKSFKPYSPSAWYAPGAAVSGLVQAIACDQKKIYPCAVLLEGEYGLN